MEKHLVPASSPAAAAWLTRDLHVPPLLVGTFVPAAFQALVRVLNPFAGSGGRKLAWSDVARELGVRLDGATNGERLCLAYAAETGEKINVDFGTLDHEVASALSGVLAGDTATPDKCYFAVWVGYSGIRGELTTAPRVMLPPEREMYLLQGPVRAAAEAVDDPPSRRSLRWWPADRTWCVGNDLYADSVYVAGSQECISALMDDPRLETHVVAYSDVHPGVYA